MGNKTCSKCKEEKPLTSEFYHKCKKSSFGFKSACKTCRSKEKKKWRDKNKERVNQVNRDYYKRNSKEIIEKGREYYYKNHEKHLEYIKKYYEENKEKELKRAAEWAKNNPEKVREKYNRYASKNHKRLLSLRKGYRQKPEYKEKVRKYKTSESGRISNQRYKHKRRLNENTAEATLSVDEWNETLLYFDNSCAYCGSSSNITQDHFIPVSKGGGYTQYNIIPCCSRCNSSKCNKEFKEWYKHQEFYCEIREYYINGFVKYIKRLVS